MVYLMICEATKTCKIGFSTDPDTRLMSVQGGRPTPVKLHAVIAGDMNAEKALHRKFKDFRLKGEWFTLDDSIIKYFDSHKLHFYKDLVKKQGRPPAFTKTKRRVIYLPEHYTKTNAEITRILLGFSHETPLPSQASSQLMPEALALVSRVLEKCPNKDYAMSRLRTWAESTMR